MYIYTKEMYHILIKKNIPVRHINSPRIMTLKKSEFFGSFLDNLTIILTLNM